MRRRAARQGGPARAEIELDRFSDARIHLQKALDLAPVLRTWANAVEEFAKDEAKAGRVVPGWKLVESLGNRKWRDESVAGEAILAVNFDTKK